MVHIRRFGENTRGRINENTRGDLADTFLKTQAGDKCEIVASGDEGNYKFGFLHTWYIDAPGADFGGTKPGVHWEIIGCNSINDLGFLDDYDDDKRSHRYKELKKFVKELDDSYGEMIFHPFNDNEGYVRLWW